MYSKIQPPTKKISKESVKVWRMTEAITNFITLAVFCILLYVDDYFAWKEWIGWILYGLITLSFSMQSGPSSLNQSCCKSIGVTT